MGVKIIEFVMRHKREAERNGFHDAWGIVLRVEYLHQLLDDIPITNLGIGSRDVRAVCGLNVIEADWFLDNAQQDCVIVDKFLGEKIEEETYRRKLFRAN